MNRDDLPPEIDEIPDQPDPWGDIPAADAAESLPDRAPSERRVAVPEPGVDTPKEKSRRRRNKRKKATHVEADATPEEPEAPIEDPWLADTPAVSEPGEELAPREDGEQPEPPEFAPPAPMVDPPEAIPAAAAAEPRIDWLEARPAPMADKTPPPTDAPPSVPPWPDRALDVLPHADRSAWPGTRDRNDRDGDDSPKLTTDTPPAPAVVSDDPALDAYTLPPPRASVGT